MQRKTKPEILVVPILFLSVVLAACGGGEEANEPGPFFPPENADSVANTALLQVSDLPVDGWEMTSADDEEEEDPVSDAAYRQIMAEEPACATLTVLLELGEDNVERDRQVGRAEIGFQRWTSILTTPEAIDMEVEIYPTIEEVQNGFGRKKAILESKETKQCFEKIFEKALTEAAEADRMYGELVVDVIDPLGDTPQDGAAIALQVTLSFPDPEMSEFTSRSVLEFHYWAYANADIAVSFLGEKESLGEYADDVLKAADRRVREAAAPRAAALDDH
jgi:hypothetical protein